MARLELPAVRAASDRGAERVIAGSLVRVEGLSEAARNRHGERMPAIRNDGPGRPAKQWNNWRRRRMSWRRVIVIADAGVGDDDGVVGYGNCDCRDTVVPSGKRRYADPFVCSLQCVRDSRRHEIQNQIQVTEAYGAGAATPRVPARLEDGMRRDEPATVQYTRIAWQRGSGSGTRKPATVLDAETLDKRTGSLSPSLLSVVGVGFIRFQRPFSAQTRWVFSMARGQF
ncbi:uncharacterized protein LY89DRAFT_669284 [Mollisia scopiformis]|uniref:Uncharacterized protein n=1 Tax=Mollisia scopiformis TaxID=149040 RepID=A0A194X9J5_MOLSC|nr:uncharacterized protein LY89DRAFT_669284 [Mollisia scopiformis]KUJ16836.1 hypothetical protein LY89DRAFT_669284 [Mollisia scopiformis]